MDTDRKLIKIVGLKTLTRAVIACFIFSLLPQVALPQQADKKSATEKDEEERMDDALAKLGFISGQAYRCVKQKEEQTKFERKSLDVANGILRLFGSDRAFFYAASFGAGAAEQMDQKKCPEVTKQHADMMAKLKVFAAR